MALRKVDFFKDSVIYYIPERALGFTVGHMWDGIRDMYNVKTIYQKMQDGVNLEDPGFPTVANSKSQYAEAASFHVRTGHLKIARDLVTANRWADKRTRVKDTFEKFVQQMRAFRLVENQSDNPFSAKKYTVSGTVDKYGKTGSGKDDLMMSFVINAYMGDLITTGKMPNMDASDMQSIK